MNLCNIPQGLGPQKHQLQWKGKEDEGVKLGGIAEVCRGNSWAHSALLPNHQKDSGGKRPPGEALQCEPSNSALQRCFLLTQIPDIQGHLPHKRINKQERREAQEK